jgi:hypothetical protein
VKRAIEIATLGCVIAGTAAAVILCVLLYDVDRLTVDSNFAVLSVATGAGHAVERAQATIAKVDGLADAARAALTNASATAIETRGLVRDARQELKSTMPLVNANLIHADLVLANMERASEHQDEVAKKTLAGLADIDKAAAQLQGTLASIQKVVDDPNLNSLASNLSATSRETARGTKAAADTLQDVRDQVHRYTHPRIATSIVDWALKIGRVLGSWF